MSTRSDVPADIIHTFNILSRDVDGLYWSIRKETEMLTDLKLPFPLDQGSWTFKHSRLSGTIKVSLSWKGIRQGALEGLVMKQTLNIKFVYRDMAGNVVEHEQTVSTSSAGCLLSRGEINLSMEDPILSGRVQGSMPRFTQVECKVFFTRRPRDVGQSSEDPAFIKFSQIYSSQFCLALTLPLVPRLTFHEQTYNIRMTFDSSFPRIIENYGPIRQIL
jgi:hypothetical protein